MIREIIKEILSANPDTTTEEFYATTDLILLAFEKYIEGCEPDKYQIFEDVVFDKIKPNSSQQKAVKQYKFNLLEGLKEGK